MRSAVSLSVFVLLLSIAFGATVTFVVSPTSLNLERLNSSSCGTITFTRTGTPTNLGIIATISNTSAITLNTTFYNVSGVPSTFNFSVCATSISTLQIVNITFTTNGTDMATFNGATPYIVPITIAIRQITFNTSSNISVPRGGCSAPYNISIS
jgi:hypothetical protein